MRFVSWTKNGTRGLAARRGSELINLDGLDLMNILEAGQQGIERARRRPASARLSIPPVSNICRRSRSLPRSYAWE
jgi:hypothetical protein